jgi:hypothetical protein
MMGKIADDERRDEDANKRKQKSSQTSNLEGSEITIEDEVDDDYDNFVSRSLICQSVTF